MDFNQQAYRMVQFVVLKPGNQLLHVQLPHLKVCEVFEFDFFFFNTCLKKFMWLPPVRYLHDLFYDIKYIM